MQNKYIKMLPCIVLLILLAVVLYQRLKVYYDELLGSTGLVFEDFEKELRMENDLAIQNEEEYQKLLQAIGEKEENTAFDDSTKNNSIKEEDLSLHALSALLLDASNNRVLYEENGYKQMPMASTTKIMTCVVTLENSDLSEVVDVSAYAEKMPDVQLNIRAGEQYYLKDLLHSLMLESHNDVAVAIAEHVGGSVEGFATMMNDKARELGCKNTNFITPNGLDAEGHYTTARDLAIIASYAIRNKEFIKITNTSSYSFIEIRKGKNQTVTNKNKFLYMMEGAIGIKTGFTGGAGYCFVGAIKRPDRMLVSVVLGCGWPPNKSLKWSDTKELMSYGITNYQEKQIFAEVEFEPLLVKDGQQRYETLYMEGDLSLLMREDEKIDIKYELPKALQAPVKADSTVGTAKYFINDMLYAELPIYSVNEIAQIDFKFCLNKVMRLWNCKYENIVN